MRVKYFHFVINFLQKISEFNVIEYNKYLQ